MFTMWMMLRHSQLHRIGCEIDLKSVVARASELSKSSGHSIVITRFLEWPFTLSHNLNNIQVCPGSRSRSRRGACVDLVTQQSGTDTCIWGGSSNSCAAADNARRYERRQDDVSRITETD